MSDMRAVVRAAREAVLHVDVDGRGGTGFCIEDPDGRPCVVTNEHVVRGAEEICVRRYDDCELPAELRFSVPELDLAILDLGEDPLEVLTLRDLREVDLGEPVVAIGSAYGMEGTVTAGIISGIDRWCAVNERVFENLLLTDALIGLGNSGGPLVGLDGEVVGVNLALHEDVAGDPSGFGYAIATNTIRVALRDFAEHGRVIRGSLELRTEMREFTAAERSRYNAPGALVIVADPKPGSPGDVGGLRRSDLIVALDGEPVRSAGDVLSLLDASRIGRAVDIEIIRSGERLPPQTIRPSRLIG